MRKAAEFTKEPVREGLAVLVVTGEEEFLRDEAVQHFRAAHGEDVEVVTTEGGKDGREFDLPAFLDDLRTSDLFGGTRIHRLANADAVLAEHQKVLHRFFSEGSAVHACILEGTALVGKSTRKEGPKAGLLGWVNKGGGEIVLCDPLYDTPFQGKGPASHSALSFWVRDRATRHGKRIGLEEAYLLHRTVGNKLRDLDRELAKIALACPGPAPIGADDIERLVGDGRLAGIFAVADAALGSSETAAFEEMGRLFEHGYADHQGRHVRDASGIALAFVAIFGQRLRKVARVIEVLAQGESFDEAAKAVRQPPFMLDRLRMEVETARRRGDVVARLQRLGRLERALKSGSGAPRLLVERYLCDRPRAKSVARTP